MVEYSAKNQKAINRELINVINRYKRNPDECNLKWIFTNLVPIVANSIWSKHYVSLKQSGYEYEDISGIVSWKFYEALKDNLHECIDLDNKNVFNYWYTMAYWAIKNEVKMNSKTNGTIVLANKSIPKSPEEFDLLMNYKLFATVDYEKQNIRRIYASDMINSIKNYVDSSCRFSNVERVIFNWALENEFDLKKDLWDQNLSENERKKVYNTILAIRKKIKSGFRRSDFAAQ